MRPPQKDKVPDLVSARNQIYGTILSYETNIKKAWLSLTYETTIEVKQNNVP